ncbi:hypothetical protein [Congregibacter sp.]|uniref:hypothetical protein n=1 Tax=Congregibacter sp. TaxID=2744308 RepID=UPI003F6AB8F0
MGELYVEYEYWVAVFQLVMVMLGMGATLTLTHFRDVLASPRAFTIGTVIQLALVPLIAYLCIWALGAVGGVAAGVALIAAIPGGTTSNIFTFFARGIHSPAKTQTRLIGGFEGQACSFYEPVGY